MSTDNESAVLSHGGSVSGQADAVARAVAIDREMQITERAWVQRLRGLGIKAAHPDDGWVDRERNTIHLCYPQFNDGLGIGDLLALGWPYHGALRIVRITGTSENRLALEPGPWYWHFEQVTA